MYRFEDIYFPSDPQLLSMCYLFQYVGNPSLNRSFSFGDGPMFKSYFTDVFWTGFSLTLFTCHDHMNKFKRALND
jgi:hypothetical protein